MKSIRLRSPAKLNLILKVLEKRPDGYHNLSTLFEKISLWDTISFKKTLSGNIRIFCSNPAVPRGRGNLAYQAALMFKSNFNIKYGVDILITKRIPIASGLAGGSSNAATTLLALNRLWGLNLSQEKLLVYASKLGADVSLFIYNYIFCLGSQRGDRIKQVHLNKKLHHILIVPCIKVYSGEVFKAFKMKLTRKNDNVNILTHALQKGCLAQANKLISNDLETAIVSTHPKLLRIKNNIEKMIGIKVTFSGSGPSMFGLTDSESKSRQIRKILSKNYARVFAVSTLSNNS